MEKQEKEQSGTQEPTANSKNNLEQINQININNHGKSTFETMIFEGLTQGGIQATASKGHGKSRLLFKVAEVLQAQPEIRILVFDGSLAWLYGYNQIPVFQIREHDILSNERKSTEDLERYSFENWHLVKLALEKHKDLLFNLQTRKPSKRSFAIRTIINYLDAQQRTEKARTANHECTKAIAYILEEAQDAFNARSTAKNECEEFLTVFNEARNNRESFFSCSQRLTDMSKTVRAKQIQVLGRLNAEDISPSLRRLEKQYKISFAEMPSRNWFYNGVIFESPEFKQNLKPFKINAEIKESWLSSLPQQRTVSLKEKIRSWFNIIVPPVPKQNERVSKSFFESENLEEESEEEKENKEDEEDLREIEEEWIE